MERDGFRSYLSLLGLYPKLRLLLYFYQKNSDNGKSIVQMRKDDSCLREGVGIVQVKEGKGHDRKMHRDS